MAGVSVVVAIRDEEAQLPGCLRRLDFADEVIVVVDDRTRDDSVRIAEEAGARVIFNSFTGFADLKNSGLDQVRSAWTLVVDADERVGVSLSNEIQTVLDQDVDGFRIPRINYFYGHKMRWGGWRESHIRLVRSGTARYVGDLHEEFRFEAAPPRLANLQAPLHHFTHRSIIDNLRKTAEFANVDARARLEAGAPPVSSGTLYFVAIREVIWRLVVKQGWRDGVPGTIECFYQPLSTLASRARLWELQQSPSIDELYARLEEEIE